MIHMVLIYFPLACLVIHRTNKKNMYSTPSPVQKSCSFKWFFSITTFVQWMHEGMWAVVGFPWTKRTKISQNMENEPSLVIRPNDGQMSSDRLCMCVWWGRGMWAVVFFPIFLNIYIFKNKLSQNLFPNPRLAILIWWCCDIHTCIIQQMWRCVEYGLSRRICNVDLWMWWWGHNISLCWLFFSFLEALFFYLDLNA